MLLLRSLTFNVFLYAYTVLCSLLAMVAAIFWPSQLINVARMWSRGWLYCYKRLCGVSVSVRGAENLPTGACIVAMKHQSTWDTFSLFAIFNRPVFVLKNELMWIPIFGWVLKNIGCIPVKRGTGRSAVESLIRGATKASALGYQTIIFPEGTRVSPGASPDYKSGVSHLYNALQIPCVPVAVNSGLLWPRRTFLRPPGVITIEILPAIPPGLPRKQMFERLVDTIETTSKRLVGVDTSRREPGSVVG